jgi:hypothetical protein
MSISIKKLFLIQVIRENLTVLDGIIIGGKAVAA